MSSFANLDLVRDGNAKKVMRATQVDIDSLFKEIELLKQGVNEVPDSFFVQSGDSLLYVPVKDGVIIFENVKSFVDENKGNWPKSLAGWIFLIVSTLMGAKGTQIIASGRKIYWALKPFVNNPLGLVALTSLVVSALVTYLVGAAFLDGVFSFGVLGSVSGLVSFGAIYIYERFIKKSEKASAEA